MSNGLGSHLLAIAASSGFLVATATPFAFRFLRHRAPTVLVLFPLLLLLYFMMQIPLIAERHIVRAHYQWLSDPTLTLSLAVDGLSLLFALLICGIGALILVYARSYLTRPEDHPRFFAFFFLFMASMLGIVLSDNLILTFICWELTSIASYFLIGFDDNRENARSAALQALLVTSAGGLMMLAGFIILALISGSYEISDILQNGDLIRKHTLYVPVLVLIAIGAFTKSAQFPFHFWLPDAMQAPTPVSAYLHSATMVKAGIFLLARLNPALAGTQAWSLLLSAVGTLTLLTGSLMALQQRDLKLMLAYMTVMALGLLVLLLGIGSPTAINAVVVYILVHSLYKGSLFLIVGNIDHGTGTRDVENLSGLSRNMKWTALFAALSALSMAGVPFLFGFVGKELVYESLWNSSPRSWLLLTTTSVSMIALVAVALLIGFRIFFSRTGKPPGTEAHESPFSMLLGPLVLAGFGVVFGVFPGLAAGLLGAASSSIIGQQMNAPLAIWHGFNPALTLSLISVLGGAIVYSRLSVIRDLLLKIFRKPSALAPKRAYGGVLDLLMLVSAKQTKFLLNGKLRIYLLWVVLFVTMSVAGLGSLELSSGRIEWSDVLYYEWVLGALMILGALTAARATSPLVSVTSLGILGYAIALTYVLYGAPDLAMTQFLIETLTVILLALVLSKLPGYPRTVQSFLSRGMTLVVCASFGLLMTVLIWKTLIRPLDRSLSDFLLTNSLPLAHGRNVVNVILVDFRALDTLGEVTVLGVAALGIFGLIRLRTQPRGGP